MSDNIQTVKLPTGVEVLAKLYKGELCPRRYANRTQAVTKSDELGEGWTVYHPGRVFYVAKWPFVTPSVKGLL